MTVFQKQQLLAAAAKASPASIFNKLSPETTTPTEEELMKRKKRLEKFNSTLTESSNSLS